MSLSLKFTPTPADYERFDQALMNYLTAGDVSRHKHFSDQVYGLIFIALFLGLVAVISAVAQVDFSVFSFGLGIVFYIFITRYKVRQIRNRVTPGPNSSVFGEHDMSLGEETFTVTAPGSSTTTAWQVVTAVQEDDRYFFIFLDSLRGFYIPKRELATEGLICDVRGFLDARVMK